MASVFAIVSKAVFEKQAKSGARVLGPGDIWTTARYESTHASLEPLASGGALYLVTARPGDVLWLVAILESPRAKKGGWESAPNTTPITDISALVSKLAFANGKGVQAGPGKLGMSLQTPRAPTPADEALLRGGPAPAAKKRTEGLRLENLRRVEEALDSLAPKQRKQVVALLDQSEGATIAEAIENEESILHGMELIDVLDEKTKKPAYELYLFQFGDGALFKSGTTEVIGNVVQHGFDLIDGDPALHASLERAWIEGKKRLGVEASFSFGKAKPRKAKAESAGEPPRARIERMRADTAAGRPPTAGEFWKLAWEVIGGYRPLPVRRPFEVDDDVRAVLEMILDRKDWGDYLPTTGIPDNYPFQELPSNLARFLGRAPAGPLDTPLDVDGKPHPLWCLVSDVLYELRAKEAVLDAIFAKMKKENAALAWRELTLLHPGGYGLRRFLYATPKDYKAKDIPNQGIPPVQAMIRRYVDFLVEYAERLGDEGARLAQQVAEAQRQSAPTSPFAIAVALAYRVHRGEPIDAADDALLARALDAPAAHELPVRPILFGLVQTLPTGRAEALIAKNRWYAELWSSPAARKPKARAWVL